jgi:hypothetical protein
MPLAQAVAILQKHCRIIRNVQVLYSEQVSAGVSTQKIQGEGSWGCGSMGILSQVCSLSWCGNFSLDNLVLPGFRRTEKQKNKTKQKTLLFCFVLLCLATHPSHGGLFMGNHLRSCL